MAFPLALVVALLAQTNSTPVAPPPDAPPALKEIAPGVFDYHGLRLDKKNRSVTFDAQVNQRQGYIEYLLVAEKGKLHESLFSTKITPHTLHLAMLLVGLKEDEAVNHHEPLPPSAIDSAYLHAAPKLKGAPVQITVTWTQDGKPRTARAESWVFNLHTQQPMTPGAWTYNGSLVEDGAFLADQELSIIAVVTDPTALVNNPREGYDDDEIWQVLDKAVPPLNTPVQITLRLADAPAAP
jgi:hypothetical protein